MPAFSDPEKSPAEKRIAALISSGWDGWIFASADLLQVFIAPPAPGDAAIAAQLGLTLALSSAGLSLIHSGHENEAS